MGNCLITKFNAVVNNDSLKKLGEITYHVTPASNGFVLFYASEANKCEIEIVGNTIASVSGNVTLIDSTHAKLGVKSLNPSVYDGITLTTVAPTKVIVKNRYYLGVFNPSGSEKTFDCNDVGTLYGVRVINADYDTAGFDFNISYISALNNLISLVIPFNSVSSNNGLVGEISALNSLTNLQRINLANNPNIKGDIKDIGSLINLTRINIANTQVSGDIESFVAKQVVNARSSCAGITLEYFEQTSVTFIDESITNNVTLSWEASDENTVITIGSSSTTIHVNPNGTWTRIS